MLDALIFDIDGTLLDSNPAHVVAWAEAFEHFGYRVAPDRIELEIGKGGDRLVPDVLGAGAEARDGHALRARQTELLLEVVRRDPIRALPGAIELLDATRARGLCAALATSSTRSHLDALLESAGLDLCAHADAVVTRRPEDRSKPAPDLVVAAVREIGLAPTQCAMVGDTRFDAIAACRAGVTCLGVLSGGKTAEELRGGGARAVWRDCADVLAHFDQAVTIASPAPGRLTTGLLAQLMRAALEEAREGLRAGEAPIGCIIADGDRRIVARAHNRVAASGDVTAHAEMRALQRIPERGAGCSDALVMVTTLEPCVMCLGAAIVAGVDTVVYGLAAPHGTGSRRVEPSCTGHHQLPRIVGGVLADDSRALLSEWLLAGNGSERTVCAHHLVATA
jgi:beta-phosphoglucomutase-like phosphatase (HAD superfamily)/tRNA(Arg) A34 adenosine deaminase TadA